MSHAQLHHEVNGWLGRTFGTPSPVAGARQVTVKSSIGLPRSLYVATTSLSRSTTGALQKKLRQAGFKGAVVEPLLRGDGGGFTVECRFRRGIGQRQPGQLPAVPPAAEATARAKETARKKLMLRG